MKGSNDKQKLMIMAVLGLGLLSVGAFQMMGGGGAPAATSEKKEAAKQEDVVAEDGSNSTNEQLHDLQLLAQRDPFDRQGTGPEGADKPITDPTAGVDTPIPPIKDEPPLPPVAQGTTNPGYVSGGPVRPEPLPGGVPPLPDVNSGAGNNHGNTGAFEPQRPSMRLSGVVVGAKPMAVLTDENGKQKLVKVGDELDGKKIIAIQRDKVVLASNDPKNKETLTWKRDVGN